MFTWSDEHILRNAKNQHQNIMGSKKSGKRSGRGNGRQSRRKAPQMLIQPAQPRSQMVKFDYVVSFTLTEGAAGIGASYVHRLNSLYDPNSTGVGNQPLGYDQWSAFFNRSVVYKCIAEVQMVNAGTFPGQFGCFTVSGASPIPTANAWASQYGAQMKLKATTGNNVFSFRRTYDIGRLLGVSKSKIMDEEDYSESPAGPAVAGNNQALFVIFTRGIGAVGVATVLLKLTMFAKLFDPNGLEVS